MTATVTEEPRSVAGTVSFWWDRVGIFAVLILMCLVMALLAPNFLSVDNAVNVARAVSINAILAAGMTMIILTGGIDLSVGSTLAVAGVAGVLLATAGVPGWLAIIGGILAGALAGFVNGAFVAWLTLPAFIVTLGSMTYLRGTAYSLLDGQPLVASDLAYRGIGNGTVAGIPTPVVMVASTSRSGSCWSAPALADTSTRSAATSRPPASPASTPSGSCCSSTPSRAPRQVSRASSSRPACSPHSRRQAPTTSSTPSRRSCSAARPWRVAAVACSAPSSVR